MDRSPKKTQSVKENYVQYITLCGKLGQGGNTYIYLFIFSKGTMEEVSLVLVFTNKNGYLREGQQMGKEQKFKLDTLNVPYFIHFTLGFHVSILYTKKQNSLNRKKTL